MPLYRPQYSPRVHPYGELKDITPEGMEAQFVTSKGGNPASLPLNYRVKTSGERRLMTYFGNTGAPKTLYLYITDDAGENWTQKTHIFPSDHVIEDGFVESRYYDNTLWFATRTVTPGGDFPSLVTWISEDLGDTWDQAWTFTLPGYDFNRHRIFPTSKGVYQAVDVTALSGPPFDTRIIGYKDGAPVLDETTNPLIAVGGITTSSYISKYETGFFTLEFTTQLGGAEIWKVTPDGFERKGKMPQSELVFPLTDIRPPLQQLWHIPRRGVLHAPTLVQTGARVYTSFDEGATWREQDGGVRINMPTVNTLGSKSIIESPASGDRFRSEGYIETLAQAVSWNDVLDAYSGSVDWHVGLERRLSRRGSKFFLWELLNP